MMILQYIFVNVQHFDNKLQMFQGDHMRRDDGKRKRCVSEQSDFL